ncbi:unnamed protein product [Arctogadus glacialis]
MPLGDPVRPSGQACGGVAALHTVEDAGVYRYLATDGQGQTQEATVVLGVYRLKAGVKAITVRVTGAEDRISTKQDDITSLLADNVAMKATIKELAVKVDDLENRSRRSNLRLVGVPEVKKDLAALSIPSLRYGVAHPATLLITYKGKRHTFDAVRTAEDFVKEQRGQQHGECG